MKFDRDDRAVSIAVTHVLTIGITTVLISGLIIGAGSMLETQQERSTEATLETIGERLAGEISDLDRMADEDETESAVIRTDHQRFASGSQYTVGLHNSSCEEYPLINDADQQCIELTSHGDDVSIAIPLSTETPLDDGVSVTGGQIKLVWEENGNGNYHITLEEQR